MNTNRANITPEVQKGTTPEKILNLLRQELRNQGLAESKIDEYILQNQERLGIDKEIVSIIESQASEGSRTSETGRNSVESGGLSSSSEQSIQNRQSNEKFTRVVGETEKVKQEIAQEGEQINIEKKSTAKEELEAVENKQTYTPKGMSGVQKVDGYTPSNNVVKNASVIASKGSINDSKTWQAVLIERLEEMWGNIQNLMGSK